MNKIFALLFCIVCFSFSAQAQNRFSEAKKYVLENPSDAEAKTLLNTFTIAVNKYKTAEKRRTSSEKRKLDRARVDMDMYFTTKSNSYAKATTIRKN